MKLLSTLVAASFLFVSMTGTAMVRTYEEKEPKPAKNPPAQVTCPCKCEPAPAATPEPKKKGADSEDHYGRKR